MVIEPVLAVSRSTREGARSVVAARPKVGAACDAAAGMASAPAATAKAASRLTLRRGFVVLIVFLILLCVMCET